MAWAHLAYRGTEWPAAVSPHGSAVAGASVPGQTPGDASAERAVRACVQTDHEHLRPYRVSGSERRFGKHGRVTEAASPEPNQASPERSQGTVKQQ